MFSVPGNRYEALEFLASDSAAAIRYEVGVTPVEHEALCRIAEHSEMWRSYAVACADAESAVAERSIKIPQPNGVQFLDRGDGEYTWVYGVVTVRMQTNTGCDAVNMAVDTNLSSAWPQKNFAGRSDE